MTLIMRQALNKAIMLHKSYCFKRLERGGVNRFVVATCRSRGVRFLLDEGSLGRAASAEVMTVEASGSDGSGSSS